MGENTTAEPRRIILMGRSGCGKTTLLQAIHNEDLVYHKTQEVIATADSIDTPGEYIDRPFFWRGAVTAACDADIVCFCQDCVDSLCRLPQMFSLTFAKPVIGIVTKADSPEANIEMAKNYLRNAGARHIVVTSAVTRQGIDELLQLVKTLDLSDY